MDFSPYGPYLPGSSVLGILQARILEQVAMLSSRGSSRPRDRTWVSHIADDFLTDWATREGPFMHKYYMNEKIPERYIGYPIFFNEGFLDWSP